MKLDSIVLTIIVVSLITSMVSAVFTLAIYRMYRNKKEARSKFFAPRKGSARNYSSGLLGVAVPSFAEGLARIFDFSGSLNENNLAEFADELHLVDLESTNLDILSKMQRDYFSAISYLNYQKEMVRRARRAYRVASHLAEMTGEIETFNPITSGREKGSRKQAASV